MDLASTNECAYSVAEYLFPIESVRVRQLMIEAADWSTNPNQFLARVASVAFAVLALLVSTVNIVIYLLAAPIKVLLNIVQLKPIQLFTDLGWDLVNAIRSFVFVALGISLVVSGLIMPEATFACFGPLLAGTPLEMAEKARENLTMRLKNNSQRNVKIAAVITRQEHDIQRQHVEIDRLTKELAEVRAPLDAEIETLKGSLEALRAENEQLKARLQRLAAIVEAE